MQTLNPKTSRVILLLVALFSLITVGKAIYYTQVYRGGDLRIREVGSRLVATGNSPYFYKWKKQDGVFFLDPTDASHRYVNGNVVTPATLVVSHPFYQLSHSHVYILWTVLQLLAAGAIIFLLFRPGFYRQHLVPASLIILGLFCSDYFLYNLERGQMYIFYTLAFALIYALYISRLTYGQYASGFVCGLLIFFRPFAILLGLGFVIKWEKKWLIGSVVGFLIGLAVFVAPVLNLWPDYFAAMSEYVNETMGHPTSSGWTAPPDRPQVIEGVDFAASKTFMLGRLETIYDLAKRVGINLSAIECLLILAGLVLVCALVFARKFRTTVEPHRLLLLGFLCYFFAEIFTPVPRGAYNVIQWAFPLGLIAIHFRHLQSLMILLVTSLVMLHQFPISFPRQHDIAELMFVAILVYSTFIAPSPATTNSIESPPKSWRKSVNY